MAIAVAALALLVAGGHLLQVLRYQSSSLRHLVQSTWCSADRAWEVADAASNAGWDFEAVRSI
jgi:hypothetical protein